MKYQENIAEVATLQPDYLGFIFYEKSSRYFNGTIPELPESIKKVGVFVNASLEEIINKVMTHDLQAVQLHGEESAEFCNSLRCQFEHLDSARHKLCRELVSGSHPTIIKVFSIKDTFDFSILKPYESVCDYFLFDTKGQNPGGNGYVFDWSVLKNYPSTKPYFLSGGIGLDEVDNIMSFLRRQESKYCKVIDVNSRFEIEAGLKDIEKLKSFVILLNSMKS